MRTKAEASPKLTAVLLPTVTPMPEDQGQSNGGQPSKANSTGPSDLKRGVTERICFTENGERVCYDADHPKASKEYRMKVSGGLPSESSTAPEAQKQCVTIGNITHCSNSTDFSIPASERPFLSHSINTDHACAVRERDQRVVCTGNNDYGQATSPDATFQNVIVVDDWTCGHTSQGPVLCWGNTGSNPKANPPQDSFKRAYFGFHSEQSCGIRQDDTIACWGSYSPELPPEPPPGTFKDLALGTSHHCALRTDNTLACWGDDTHGQSTPPTGTFQSVTTFGDYSCARRTGTAKRQCWGDYPFNSNR